MPDVVKHAWTHRPRAEGGSDPFDIEKNPAAIATGNLASLTLTGTDFLPNNVLWASPNGPYTNSGVDPTDFDYIMINQDGCYRAMFYAYWSTDFGASTFPFIEPGCLIDGTPDSIVNFESLPFFGPVFDNTQSWIGGEQFTAAEMDHHSVWAEVVFNLSFSAAGIGSFGIGNTLRSSFSGTKSVGSKLAVYRICGYLEEVT